MLIPISEDMSTTNIINIVEEEMLAELVKPKPVEKNITPINGIIIDIAEVIITTFRRTFLEADIVRSCGLGSSAGPSKSMRSISFFSPALSFRNNFRKTELDRITSTTWVRVNIRGAERWMLQPSKHAEIEDYELAQDSVGVWFSAIGLKRGEKRKQAFREAVAKGEEPPEKRQHVRPVEYRRKEDIRQAKKAQNLLDREAVVAEREMAADRKTSVADARIAEGEAIIAGAKGLADASLELEAADSGPRLRAAPASPDGAKARDKLTRLYKSPRGHKRIAAALSAALQQIRRNEKASAEARARAELAREFADIEAADAVILQIAEMLPGKLREQIAKARRSLSARIHALRGAIAPEEHRRPKDRGDE